jgi:hypothetical protein
MLRDTNVFDAHNIIAVALLLFHLLAELIS